MKFTCLAHLVKANQKILMKMVAGCCAPDDGRLTRMYIVWTDDPIRNQTRTTSNRNINLMQYSQYVFEISDEQKISMHERWESRMALVSASRSLYAAGPFQLFVVLRLI